MQRTVTQKLYTASFLTITSSYNASFILILHSAIARCISDYNLSNWFRRTPLWVLSHFHVCRVGLLYEI